MDPKSIAVCEANETLRAAGLPTYSKLRAMNAELLAALTDTLQFLERHSNRWDGGAGKHPQEVADAAREAIKNATA